MAYFEDFHVGDVRELGSRTLTREEIIDFARQFDPQPFHIDEEAARDSIFGGIIASGWHLTALAMRILVDSMLGDKPESGSLGSPGADEIRWLKPARPGDTLSMRAEVIATTPSRSRPERGVIRLKYLLRNQHGEDVMTMIGIGMFKRRPNAAPTT
jgi:acyl dehydratase